MALAAAAGRGGDRARLATAWRGHAADGSPGARAPQSSVAI